jgi:hypothetical protein
MVSSGVLGRVTLVRSDVSEELSPSFIRVTRIGELGSTLAVTSNRRMLVTSQKTPFFIVTAVKTSNLTSSLLLRGLHVKRAFLRSHYTVRAVWRGTGQHSALSLSLSLSLSIYIYICKVLAARALESVKQIPRDALSGITFCSQLLNNVYE